MSQLTVTIRQRPNADEIAAYALDLAYNPSYTMDSFVYTYGVQPLSLTDQQLKLVYDTFERSRGPAWFFALHYDKTVILPEQYLMPNDNTSSAEVHRRMMFGPGPKRKGLAQSGEKPWICTWPSTILEVFIYAGQDTAPQFPMPSRSSGTTSSSPPPTESSRGTKWTHGHRRGPIGPPYDHGGYGEGDEDGDGDGDDGDGDDDDDDYPPRSPPPTPPPSSTPTESSASSKATPTPSGGQKHSGPPPNMPPPPPLYPKVIKVEERRNPEIKSPLPTCRQVKIIDKGHEAVPVQNEDGENIEIQIAEVVLEDEEKQSDPFLLKRHSSSQPIWGRNDAGSNGNEISDCGCIWWLT